MGVLASSAAIVVACGSENATDDGSSGTGSSSGMPSGSSSFGGSTSGGGVDSGDDGNPANCLAPVDMYIMFDRSGSMGMDCNLGQTVNSKWCKAINALSGYFKSTGSTGQAAALQFFPLPGHTQALCSTGNQYSTPALPTADYQLLPSSAFDTLLNQTVSNGGNTPTEAAIRGLTAFTAANRRPGKVTIGILITDGDPNGCNEDLGDLSNLLQAHHAATTIRTYVIGMEGASFGKLEQIAQGGNAPTHADNVSGISDACGDGAGPCRHWNVGDGDPAVFGAALAAIQESADGCKPGGGIVNPPK